MTFYSPLACKENNSCGGLCTINIHCYFICMAGRPRITSKSVFCISLISQIWMTLLLFDASFIIADPDHLKWLNFSKFRLVCWESSRNWNTGVYHPYTVVDWYCPITGILAAAFKISIKNIIKHLCDKKICWSLFCLKLANTSLSTLFSFYFSVSEYIS